MHIILLIQNQEKGDGAMIKYKVDVFQKLKEHGFNQARREATTGADSPKYKSRQKHHTRNTK